MRLCIPGLGGRLQRARRESGLSQDKVANMVGVSWMTVHRWEVSQRLIADDVLDRLCSLYDKPLLWFLTLEDGDLDQVRSEPSIGPGAPDRAGPDAAERLYRKISEAPAVHRPMIERVVEDMLDALK